MPIYYPAAAALLRVRWRDDGTEDTFLGLQPRRLTIENNGIRTADTISHLEFDARAFPFDPRLARSIEIGVSLGQREDARAPYTFNATDAAFVGFADEYERLQDERGERIMLNGRDYTGFLLDTRYTGQNIPAGPDIATVVQGILSHVPAAAKLTVRSLVDETEVKARDAYGTKVPKVGAGNGRHRPRTVRVSNPIGKAMSKAQKHAGKPVPEHNSVWDVIQDLCDGLGFIAFIQRDELTIAHPRVLSDPAQALSAPRLMWGRNLEKLTVKRSVNKLRAPNIQLVCHVPGKAKPIEGRWPQPWVETESIQHADGTTQKVYRPHRYAVTGISDPAVLTQQAQRIYEQLAVSEIELQVATRDLTTADSAGVLRDLTQLRDGDPLTIELDPGLLDLMDNQPASARAALLEHRGYTADTAQALARHWDAMSSYSTTFRVKTARHEWDQETGYRLSVDAVNYLDAGGGAQGQPGKATG